MERAQGDRGISSTSKTRRLDLRRALRVGTADRHARLDAMFTPMMQPGGEPHYARFLQMNLGCHEELEPLLEASPLMQIIPDWPSWSRLPHLRRDLATISLPKLGLPRFSILRPDLQQAIGVAYVLEGSRLGAILIDRQFENAELSGTPLAKARHYVQSAAQGDAFVRLMNAAAGLDWSGQEMQRAVSAADLTFDYFLQAADISKVPSA